MADFTTSGIGEGVQSPFTPTQPIVNTAPAAALDGIGNAIKFLSKKGKEKDPLVAVSDELFRDMSKLAARRSSGNLSLPAYQTELNRTISKYTALDIPGIGGVVQDVVNKSSATAGFGKVAQQQTAVEKQDEADFQEAISLGFDIPGLEKEQILQLFRPVKKAQFDLANAQAQQTYDRGNLAFSQAIREEKSQVAVSNVATAYVPALDAGIRSLVAQFDSGDLSSEEAEVALNQLWNSQGLALQQAGGAFAGEQFVQGVTGVMDNMRQEASKYFSGESTLERVKRENDLAIALTTQSWYSDPSIRNHVVAQGIYRNSDLLDFIGNTNSAVMTRVMGMTGVGDVPNLMSEKAEPEDLKTTIKMTRSILKNAVADPENSPLAEQADSVVLNTLESVSVNADRTTAAQSFQPVLSFMASKEFGDYVKLNGLPQEAAVDAMDALETNYIRKLQDKVNNDFVNKTFTFGGDRRGRNSDKQAFSELIEPVFNGIGVSFRLKKDLPKNLDEAKTKDLNKKVRALNRGSEAIAPAFNQLVKVSANLAGTPGQFRRSYDILAEQMFGVESESEVEDGEE